MTNKELGTLAEKLTSEHYKFLGYLLVEQNYRYKNFGEIDLILSKKDILVFCEVKCRSQNSISTPASAVNKSKQYKIKKTATIFLLKNKKYADYIIRFDVAEVIKNNDNMSINIIENAF